MVKCFRYAKDSYHIRTLLSWGGVALMSVGDGLSGLVICHSVAPGLSGLLLRYPLMFPSGISLNAMLSHLFFINFDYIICGIGIYPCAYHRCYITAYIVNFPELGIDDVPPLLGFVFRNSFIGSTLLQYIRTIIVKLTHIAYFDIAVVARTLT